MRMTYDIEKNEIRKLSMLFVVASLILTLIASVVPFSFAEEGNMEEQTLIAKAELGRPSKVAISGVPYGQDAAVFNKEVILSSDAALRLNRNGIKIVGNQINAGVAENEFSRLNVDFLEYKAKSIEMEDILPSISTISSNDKKILGVVLPPFVYLGKRF